MYPLIRVQFDALNKAGYERFYTEKARGSKKASIEIERALDTLRARDVLFSTDLIVSPAPQKSH